MSLVAPHPWEAMEKVRVSVEQYRRFRTDGFLVVKGLVRPEHVAELRSHCDDLLYGRVDMPNVPPYEPGEPLEARAKKLLRIHMGHRDHELWERYLLYPRVLDVLEVLQGPDILAMQTMLFIKGPGSNGQGFHQDTYYIPTFPDTLIGAWIAIDRADIENGCLWMAKGSQHEPIYPPSQGYGFGDVGLADIPSVSGVGGHSNDDDDPQNTLKPFAERYEQVPAIAEPGDVVFFGGHIMHRSLRNRSKDRYRRCLVNHYCNARSYTTWDGGSQNHILARGNTHMAFARPKFGTPCAALNPKESISDRGAAPTMMMATEDGMMGAQAPAPEDHDH
ncbi:MAG TPA: phytanoyl-CoA dioxygenase family protein [Fimbriimonas sp.]